MNKTTVKSGLVSGVFVIIASAVSGCAVNHAPMATTDLEYYRVDCRIKEQQVRFLLSLRSNPDDRLLAGANNILQPWQILTNPNASYERHQVHSGKTNWLINQHLLELRKCP